MIEQFDLYLLITKDFFFAFTRMLETRRVIG